MWDSGAITSGGDTALLADAAERLRAVRQAHARFLALWAVDHLLADAAGALADAVVDGFVDGVGGCDATPDNHAPRPAAGRWLFRDGRLDD